jgi:DNA-binding response OmpR family regulator
MEHLPPELDAFIHALISPLTALQGSASLIRRRYGAGEDARFNELLQTLERSAMRLRGTCDLLINHAAVHEQQIAIQVPVAAFYQPKPPSAEAPPPTRDEQPAPAVPPSQTHGAILIIAHPALGARLGDALSASGDRVLLAANAVMGLDLARRERPAAIVLEDALDEQSRIIAPILQEDPDTKSTPLIVLVNAPDAPSDPTRAWHAFDATLPTTVLASHIRDVLSRAQQDGRSTPHLLIVDDESDIAHMIAQQFRDEGYLTTTVHNGTEALQIVRERQFDLVLLDLLLPDLDGFTVLGGLRARPETQLTPILLLSALNSPAEKVRGLQLGADDYITKPFSAAELSARVQAAMRRSEREGGANPSTRLPGNLAIERAMLQRIEQQTPFAVCYCDLDNFKAYNDAYGFLKGDAVIQRTAQILLDAVHAAGNADDFVGHIGGDDFVVISTPDRVEAVCRAIISRFDAAAPLFYDAEAREHGYITGVDRRGRPASFPLLSLSIVVASSARRPFSHPGEIAQRSILPKRQAKQVERSTYIIVE